MVRSDEPMPKDQLGGNGILVDLRHDFPGASRRRTASKSMSNHPASSETTLTLAQGGAMDRGMKATLFVFVALSWSGDLQSHPRSIWITLQSKKK